MRNELVQIHVPPSNELQRNLRILRDVMDFGSVNKAGISIFKQLLGHSIEQGILSQSEAYGAIINRPDADPFKQAASSRLKIYPVEIETRRQGIDNKDIWHKIKNRTDEWPRKQENAIIIDSCIARGTTSIEKFIPEINKMSSNVKRIIFFVLLATEEGLDKIEQKFSGSFDKIHVVTAAVDPGFNRDGWIQPGVGPDSFTKRITEKMGVTPIWSEYKLDIAKTCLAKTLSSSNGWRQALNISILWLTWLSKVNRRRPVGYRKLEEWVKEIDSASGLKGTDQSITQTKRRSITNGSPFSLQSFNPFSYAMDQLIWRELLTKVKYGYNTRKVGDDYLGKVCIPAMEEHQYYDRLFDTIQTIYPKLR